ncbi:MAG: hypothetical protein COW03_02335 [Cytophagales bacterium CG12_big_fil_rev_8_21_14_0_65_40_12]|nr:MAG: hypothetical protein COW03_02335 [Cytophagales bacterium CG12_big_fil_rev_8_21_14_0_65_40_12]PIW02913.1 MAG: hypothetical protein COW40_17620 [Cytophagales bacterium CG17_big_fil_post_rev_8_21_14_2_50_40_13]
MTIQEPSVYKIQKFVYIQSRVFILFLFSLSTVGISCLVLCETSKGEKGSTTTKLVVFTVFFIQV